MSLYDNLMESVIYEDSIEEYKERISTNESVFSNKNKFVAAYKKAIEWFNNPSTIEINNNSINRKMMQVIYYTNNTHTFFDKIRKNINNFSIYGRAALNEFDDFDQNYLVKCFGKDKYDIELYRIFSSSFKDLLFANNKFAYFDWSGKGKIVYTNSNINNLFNEFLDTKEIPKELIEADKKLGYYLLSKAPSDVQVKPNPFK